MVKVKKAKLPKKNKMFGKKKKYNDDEQEEVEEHEDEDEEDEENDLRNKKKKPQTDALEIKSKEELIAMIFYYQTRSLELTDLLRRM